MELSDERRILLGRYAMEAATECVDNIEELEDGEITELVFDGAVVGYVVPMTVTVPASRCPWLPDYEGED